MQSYYESLLEKDRRRYAAIEAKKLDYGIISYTSRLFGCNYRTISKRIAEQSEQSLISSDRICRPGRGKKVHLTLIDRESWN